jgi:hypothetical protein
MPLAHAVRTAGCKPAALPHHPLQVPLLLAMGPRLKFFVVLSGALAASLSSADEAPIGRKCEVALKDDCGEEDRKNVTRCEKCVDRNRKDLLAAKCTERDVVEYCHVPPGPSPGPSPPPGPPGPSPPTPSPPIAHKCEAALKDDCGQDRKNVTKCEKCVNRNHKDLLAAKCTERDVVEYCRVSPGPSPPPPPGPPGPKGRCGEELDKECGDVRARKSECLACVFQHAEVLKRANCTGYEADQYCGA